MVMLHSDIDPCKFMWLFIHLTWQTGITICTQIIFLNIIFGCKLLKFHWSRGGHMMKNIREYFWLLTWNCVFWFSLHVLTKYWSICGPPWKNIFDIFLGFAATGYLWLHRRIFDTWSNRNQFYLKPSVSGSRRHRLELYKFSSRSKVQRLVVWRFRIFSKFKFFFQIFSDSLLGKIFEIFFWQGSMLPYFAH